MSIDLNFSLVGSMFWAYFIGFALTIGVGTGVMLLAAFQQLFKPSKKKQPTGDAVQEIASPKSASEDTNSK